ncbi:MAG: membrane protein insertase YidC, partial [Xanthobacteraceae bacterium]
MSEHKNTILAIVLSLLVVVGWQYFIGYPQMERQRQEAQLKQQEQQAQTQPGATQSGSAPPGSAQSGTPQAGATPPTPEVPG